MKIMMLPTWFGGVSWWRFEVPAKALQQAGHEVYCPTNDQLTHTLKQYQNNFFDWILAEMPKYDIIHIGYNPDPNFAIAFFKARDIHKIPVITDIDDNLDHVPSYNKGWNTFHPGGIGHRVTKTQLRYSDGISFSTDPLAESLGYLSDNPTKVLENWIDIDSWDYPTPIERKEDQSIRLMITGGGGRFGDWTILQEPLEWAMKKFDGQNNQPMLRLFFMGATPDWVQPWLMDKENPLANRCFYLHPTNSVKLFNKIVRYISPDIILSSTVKNEFNRSKSGLKFLESSLAGAAFICTDFDTYSNAPEGTCLKVDNTFTQWQAALEEAITNKELRQRLTDKAKSYVLDYCDAKDHITPRLEFYQSVLEDYKCRMSPPAEQGQEATLAPDKP